MQNDDRAAEYIGRMKEEGVCYNLCFPLSRSLPRHVTLLDEDTVDDDYKDDDDDDDDDGDDDDKEMTLKMLETELMSAALPAAVFTLYTILSLSKGPTLPQCF